MDEFETISLDSRECEICKQQTEEELISCVLHENFPSSRENISQTGSSNGNEATFAHRICLERWDAVMKNTFYPQPKKTWKDRLKGLISAGQASVETWTPVTTSHSTDSLDDPNRTISTTRSYSSATGHSVFRESKEAYRVAEVGHNRGQWRTSKVRICSVDLEDSEKDQQNTESPVASEQCKFSRHTKSTCKYK